jgi:hypothetical protein
LVVRGGAGVDMEFANAGMVEKIGGQMPEVLLVYEEISKVYHQVISRSWL